MSNLKDKLVQDFLQFESSLNGKSQSDIHIERKKAIAQFEKSGFPTNRNEEWKYTDSKELQNHSFNILALNSKLTKEEIHKHFIPGLSGNQLVFLNGRYRADFSSIVSPASELIIKDLKDIIYTDEFSKIKAGLGKYKKFNNDGFIDLNQAFAENGIYIQVPENKSIIEPVILYFIADSDTENAISIPQVYLNVNANSSLKVVEHYIKIGNQVSFSNTLTEFLLAKNTNSSI